MKEKFYKLPAVLRKQVYLRLGFGLFSLILLIVMTIQYRNIRFCIPCIIVTVFLLSNGFLLLYRFICGQYLVIEGICSEAETSQIKGRVSFLNFIIDNQHVRMPVYKGNIKAGDNVIVYVSEKAPVYEQSGGLTIYNYYAVEVRMKPDINRHPKQKIVNNFK